MVWKKGIDMFSDMTYSSTMEAMIYKPKFDINGGNATTSSITVYFNSPYGSLATVSKLGFQFNGWYEFVIKLIKL